METFIARLDQQPDTYPHRVVACGPAEDKPAPRGQMSASYTSPAILASPPSQGPWKLSWPLQGAILGLGRRWPPFPSPG